MNYGISNISGDTAGKTPRTFIEVFSIPGTISLTTNDWYTSSAQWRGKYNLVYQPLSFLDINNAFYDDYRHNNPYNYGNYRNVITPVLVLSAFSSISWSVITLKLTCSVI